MGKRFIDFDFREAELCTFELMVIHDSFIVYNPNPAALKHFTEVLKNATAIVTEGHEQTD